MCPVLGPLYKTQQGKSSRRPLRWLEGEGAGFIWPGEEGNTIAVFSCQVGVTRWSQTLLGDMQSKDKRHVLQQGEILQGTRGEREKKCSQ